MLGEESEIPQVPVDRPTSYVSPALPPSTGDPQAADESEPHSIIPDSAARVSSATAVDAANSSTEPTQCQSHDIQPQQTLRFPDGLHPPQPLQAAQQEVQPSAAAGVELLKRLPLEDSEPIAQPPGISTASPSDCGAGVGLKPGADADGCLEDIMAAVARLEEQGRLVEASALMAKGLQ